VSISERELRAHLVGVAAECPPVGVSPGEVEARGRRLRRRARVASGAVALAAIVAVAAVTMPNIRGGHQRPPATVTDGYQILQSATGTPSQTKQVTFTAPADGHVEVQFRCSTPPGTVGALDVTLEFSSVPPVTVPCYSGLYRGAILEQAFGFWHPGLTYRLTITPRAGSQMRDWEVVVYHITAAQDLLNQPISPRTGTAKTSPTTG
jgi:hypothetical protein